jgi:hypothetical protein
MAHIGKPPAVLRLPVALLAFALASGAPADDPDNRPDRADIPPYVTKRVDLLVHEPAVAPAEAPHARERMRNGTPPARPGG